MTDAIKAYTLEDFIEFIHQPENADQLFEFIDGEIIAVSPGRTWNSSIADLIVVTVHLFCREHSLTCYTTSGDGAFVINGQTVAPDFAYKPTPTSKEYPDPVPPLLVVEIVSPTDRPIDIQKKRRIYVQAGILYWELYPDGEIIDIHPPGQPVKMLDINGILDGGDVLPGFTLAVRDIFPKDESE